MCKLGMPTFCLNGGVFGTSKFDGCQAEYARIPLADGTLIKIPEGLSDEDVLLLGDMLATAWFGLKNAPVSPGQTVAVIGLGPVGQCTCLLASKVFGARKVVAVDVLEDRIKLALQAGVADVGINAAAGDAVEKIKEATGGLGVDVSVETAGTLESFDMALGATRTKGIVSTVSLFAQAFTVPMNLIIYKGLTIKMGMQSCEGVDEMLELIKAGKIDPKYLLTHKAPLNDILKGYETFGNHQDGCMKWVVTPYER